MKDNKGCIKVLIGFILFVAIGNLLFKGILKLGNYPAIILMTILGVVFIGFVIMCVLGMKKEKGED